MSLPIPAARREGFTASTSVPLYWREDGPADAPPIVLLHGGPGAHHDYLYPQMLELARSHRVIAYDQRGGGRSRTDDPAPITWRTQVDDLASVLRELDLQEANVSLVGYSWGALLAMLYAIETGLVVPDATPLNVELSIGQRGRAPLPHRGVGRGEALPRGSLSRVLLPGPRRPAGEPWGAPNRSR